MVGELVGCLVLAYVVTYFSAWKGIASTGKMVYVTCLLPYVILTILLIKGLTLEGCGTGLNYLFVPNWEIVGKTETWKAAAIQILFSSGVAYGPFMYYGSCRGKTDKIVAISFWIPLANSATSIYAALTIFSFIGHVAVVKKIPINLVATSGPTLFFVAFPSLLGLLPGANFWSVIFFIMAVCLGIDSVFGFFDYYIKIAEDAFPLLRKKLRKELQVLVITIFSFIWSLMFVVEGGFHNFDLFDANAGHIQLLLVLVLQSILLPWIFGMHKLSTLIYLRTG
jgi:SNF family Na+-dependent transporter